MSTFLRDPHRIGPVTPALGGVLGSYALVGALLAGTLSDGLGRRKLMLPSYAWFSVRMAVTALMTPTTGFGLLRLVAGLGVGSLGDHRGDRRGVRPCSSRSSGWAPVAPRR